MLSKQDCVLSVIEGLSLAHNDLKIVQRSQLFFSQYPEILLYFIKISKGNCEQEVVPSQHRWLKCAGKEGKLR